MIKVLVVEDSPVVREFLVYILDDDPDIKVIGAVTNGEEAVEAAGKLKPDVVTMDIHMPKMDGFEATRRIMETHPVPIVIVSGSSSVTEVSTTFRAIEAGALTVVARPNGIGHEKHEASVQELVCAVKLMSEVKVVRRWTRERAKRKIAGETQTDAVKQVSSDVQLVAVGASTGGPLVLQTLLSELPEKFPIPVLIVQHISSGFLPGLVEWLAQSSRLTLHVAKHREKMLPGHVYFAPDDFHAGVDADGLVLLSKAKPENGLRPSVSYLFRSVAEVFGNRSAGILLTGMGKDGAYELKQLKEKGAVTIAQDEKSCVVYGMPGEAVKLDAARHVLAPDEIAEFLKDLRPEARHEEKEKS